MGDHETLHCSSLFSPLFCRRNGCLADQPSWRVRARFSRNGSGSWFTYAIELRLRDVLGILLLMLVAVVHPIGFTILILQAAEQGERGPMLFLIVMLLISMGLLAVFVIVILRRSRSELRAISSPINSMLARYGDERIS
jgi:hypothetical protein